MNGTSLVADTNIILYLFSGDQLVAEILNEKQIYISFITELELLSFKELTKTEHLKIIEFISECTIIDINPFIKELSISLRKKYSLKLPDAIVSATSAFLKIPLISADVKLKKVKEIDLVFYDIE
jgi:predicted nucleic acid-binding protein